MQLSTLLYTLRKKNKIRQRQLCDSIGITQTYYSQIENDIKKPSITVIYKICKYYNITLADFAKKLVENDITYEQKVIFNSPNTDEILNLVMNKFVDIISH